MNAMWNRWENALRREDRETPLREEVEFWSNWFATQGSEWPQDYQNRLNPLQPLQQHVSVYVDRFEGDHIHILDVGAGPLTKLGKVHPQKKVLITATDLLAAEYDRLLEKFLIKPLVRTIYADTENLISQFAKNSFDLVHGQNCIDHTSDPIRAMDQMIKVTKPDGFVVLFHVENEGKKQSYSQLHKWDFRCCNGEFVIQKENEKEINVSRKFESTGKITCQIEDGEVLVVIHKKNPSK